MAIVRNTTKSRRYIEGGGRTYDLPYRKDVEIPDDVIARYKDRGPGIRRLFDSGMLVVKGAGRVVRMESAPTNERPKPNPPAAGVDETGSAGASVPEGGAPKKKRTRKRKPKTED